jgi:hypothetical protein
LIYGLDFPEMNCRSCNRYDCLVLSC